MGRKPLTGKYTGELNRQAFRGGEKDGKEMMRRGAAGRVIWCVTKRRQHRENGFCTWCESERRGWAGNWEVKEGNNVHSHQTMLQTPAEDNACFPKLLFSDK